MIQKLIKVGNSLGIIIPKDILKLMKLKVGDKVWVDYDVKKQEIRIYPLRNITKSPEGLSWLRTHSRKRRI